jgi:hypothetical protein
LPGAEAEGYHPQAVAQYMPNQPARCSLSASTILAQFADAAHRRVQSMYSQERLSER